ncbi:restriction endonuclease subunit S [Virgibacillus sp. DJP39]|uniref:restriction endonuclease subunit S n=1 Tax=Virgibacillus sp. DJP39 TaxID=3409790 RepID=UPI003BB6F7B2
MSKKVKKKKTIEEMLEEALVPEEEQSYEVPGNWIWVKLGYVAQFINGDRGKNYPSRNDLITNGVPFINAGHLIDGKLDMGSMNYISIEKFNSLGSGKVSNSDVLYCLRGTLGKTAVVSDVEKGAIASSLVIIRANKKVNYIFLYYYLVSSLGRKMIKVHDNGSAQPNLSANNVKKYTFPFPPYEEQKRIAEKVERLLNKIDAAKQLIDEAKETFELRRAAILNKAFRGELDDNVSRNESDNQDKIDGVPYLLPSGWKWVALEQITDFENGDRSSAYPKAEELVNQGIPFLSTKELKGNVIKFDENTKYITEKKFNTLRSGKLKNDDILMCIRGSVGKVGLFKGSNETNTGFVNAQLVILRSQQTIVPKYLLAYLSSQIFNNLLEKVTTGSAQPQLSVKELKQVLCPLPPVEVQRAIIYKTDKIISKIEKEYLILSNINFAHLKSSVLSKAFRGELGTNNPSDENSIELLKEVLQKQM